MRTELGLALKHVGKGGKKVNVVNYFTKPPTPVDEYYYEEDAYVVKEKTGGFRQNA